MPAQSIPLDRRPLRIGVLISGSGSTLANLIERIADGRLRAVRIALVVSSRSNVRGVEVARAAALPLEVIRRRDFSSDLAFGSRITAALRAHDVELVVMGGFLCFWPVPPEYAGRALNIHPALLPAFGGRGMHGTRVHEAVLAAGAPESGCTVHVVNDEYDSGPIVAQQRVPVQPGDTPESLAARVGAAEHELYPQVIQRAADEGLAWLSSPDPLCSFRTTTDIRG